MLIQTQVGPIAVLASIPANIQPPLRSGNMGDLIVSQLHGRYYETNYRRNMFVATSNNSIGSNTSAGTLTTYFGLCVSNPVGSPVNIVLNKINFTVANAFTTVTPIGLMTGYNSSTSVTHTANAFVKSAFTGVGAVGQGLADWSATLSATPTVTHVFATGYTGAISTTPLPSSPTIVDLEGSVILPPGAFAAIWTPTALPSYALFAGMSWEEIPT